MAQKKRAVSRVPKTGEAAPTRVAIPPTGFALPADALERALLTGESRGLLEDYFGPENYAELQDLAREAATRSVRGGLRVLIVPGIMGSTLARKVLLNLTDTLWVNPLEIALGKLFDLKLNGGASPYFASGVILLAYLKLKLRLKIAGMNADFFAFDWRRSVVELGKQLAKAINDDAAPQVSLVAHSMGGLIARAALPGTRQKVRRLLMLGTPNYGSFAPVQVFRATYDVVLKIAKVDRRHTPEQLCGEVFNTFPGLYEMLPAPDKFTALNLYDARNWPKTGPQPRQPLLNAVKPAITQLAKADERFFLVAGVNQNTVVGLHLQDGQFAYECSPEGDGTVPLDFAKLANIPQKQIYYVEDGHGHLPNNGKVETAVIDLLASGTTSALSNQMPALRRESRVVSEAEVREMALRAAGVGELGTADYRHLLDAVAAPPRRALAMAVAGVAAGAETTAAVASAPLASHFEHLTIGRRRQRRLDLTLAHGSITDVDCRAYVLGVFRNVAPSGAAKAIDQRLDGAITEFTARRMFSGDVGTVFTIPIGRKQLPADIVLFAGLGAFDRFTADVQQLVAENVVRVLVRSRVEEFATILIGAGSGQSAAGVLQNLLSGFFRGLKDADPQQRFRAITLCEADATRFGEMKQELYRLAGTALFDEMELTLNETEVPPSPVPAARVLRPGAEPVYMIARTEGQTSNQLHCRFSILGAGMKAAVVSAAREISSKQLDELLRSFDEAVNQSSAEEVKSFGKKFSQMVMAEEVATVLEAMKDRHLVVVHDAPLSRIPWETLTIRDWSPAIDAGLSRHYLADNLPVATWLETRREQPSLKLLLVANPLGDLDGADKEAKRITDLGDVTAAIEVTLLSHGEATKAAILSALRTGKYDCIHYAGHAFFDERAPGRSGLVCAGREVLSGPDLLGISNLPFLIFFNACQAGRVRGRPARPSKPASTQAAESAGVAEALMRGGVANYMSTYWPVGDDSAMTFSSTFYKNVLAGSAIGAALLEGRQAIIQDRDWADYILYGNFDFVLKQTAAPAA